MVFSVNDRLTRYGQFTSHLGTILPCADTVFFGEGCQFGFGHKFIGAHWFNCKNKLA